MNVVLIGFMGSGKTFIGRILAQKLGFSFMDMDGEIECSQRMKISDIFARFGEQEFRRIESDTLLSMQNLDRYVISTGGGVVVKQENRPLLKKIGVVVWLKTTPEKVYQRVKDDTSRPLLQVDDPLAKIKELMDYREDFYRQSADIVVDSDLGGPEYMAGLILKELKERGLIEQ